jgi:hypothetical protein
MATSAVEIDIKRETALTLLENGAVTNLTEAAEMIGVDDTTLGRWRNSSPDFRRRWDAAMARAKARRVDQWESAMSQRALDVKNPVGVTAGIFLLKSHRAHQYADRPQGLNLTVNIDKAQVNLAGQTVEEMRKLEGKPDDGTE